MKKCSDSSNWSRRKAGGRGHALCEVQSSSGDRVFSPLDAEEDLQQRPPCTRAFGAQHTCSASPLRLGSSASGSRETAARNKPPSLSLCLSLSPALSLSLSVSVTVSLSLF